MVEGACALFREDLTMMHDCVLRAFPLKSIGL